MPARFCRGAASSADPSGPRFTVPDPPGRVSFVYFAIMLSEQLVATLRPQVVFGRVLVADALAPLGRLRDLAVVARVGVRSLERQSIVDEDPQLDELSVPVQLVSLDDSEFL